MLTRLLNELEAEDAPKHSLVLAVGNGSDVLEFIGHLLRRCPSRLVSVIVYSNDLVISSFNVYSWRSSLFVLSCLFVELTNYFCMFVSPFSKFLTVVYLDPIAC